MKVLDNKEYRAMDNKGGRFFDDMAALLSGGLEAASGVQRETSAFMRHRAAKIADELNLITRETHDITAAMAAKARQDNEALAQKIKELEARIAQLESAQKNR